MAEAGASSARGNIFLDFAWRGPTDLHGGFLAGGRSVHVVKLVFQNANSSISVDLPYGSSPSEVQRFKFQVERFQIYIEKPSSDGRTGHVDSSVKVTYSDQLKVTIEKIRHLKLVACLLKSVPQQANAAVKG